MQTQGLTHGWTDLKTECLRQQRFSTTEAQNGTHGEPEHLRKLSEAGGALNIPGGPFPGLLNNNSTRQAVINRTM